MTCLTKRCLFSSLSNLDRNRILLALSLPWRAFPLAMEGPVGPTEAFRALTFPGADRLHIKSKFCTDLLRGDSPHPLKMICQRFEIDGVFLLADMLIDTCPWMQSHREPEIQIDGIVKPLQDLMCSVFFWFYALKKNKPCTSLHIVSTCRTKHRAMKPICPKNKPEFCQKSMCRLVFSKNMQSFHCK